MSALIESYTLVVKHVPENSVGCRVGLGVACSLGMLLGESLN